MAACDQITAGLDPACSDLKAIGGIDARIYVGQISDIDEAVLTFGLNGEITAFALKTTPAPAKTLKKFIGKAEKNSTVVDGVVGENVNLFNQQVNLVLYAKDQAKRNAAQNLYLSEGMFLIVETNGSPQSPGTLEVYGLGVGLGSMNNFGLKGSAYQNNSGTALNDPNNITITLSGQHPNDAIAFIPASTLAANITLLDAMSI